MEAIAIFDFAATAEDELSFKKGNILHILQTDRDANWFNAELNEQVGFVPKNYIQMRDCPWYHGKITRLKAEEKLLKQKEDGAFLLRDSETNNEPGSFSLSVKFENAVQHFKVLKDQHFQYYLWIKKFPSLNQLIDHHRTTSVSRQHRIFLKDLALPRLARANFDFERQEDGEISFKKSELIEILDTNHTQWWKGQLYPNGDIGYFPSTFVTPINDDGTQ